MFDDTLNSASNLPVSPSEKVHLSDLNWADREKVLRLLFAKINATQGNVRPMPAHPIAEAKNQARARQTQAMTSMLDAREQQQQEEDANGRNDLGPPMML